MAWGGPRLHFPVVVALDIVGLFNQIKKSQVCQRGSLGAA
jgi:hypothetical protein